MIVEYCRKLMNDIYDIGVDVARDKYYSWAVVFMPDKAYTLIFMYATLRYYLRNILK